MVYVGFSEKFVIIPLGEPTLLENMAHPGTYWGDDAENPPFMYSFPDGKMRETTVFRIYLNDSPRVYTHVYIYVFSGAQL